VLNQRHVAHGMRIEQPAFKTILKRLKTVFQYTPLACIPTSATAEAANHAASSASPPSAAQNVRVC
jgi:hypothetical protein